MSVSSSEEDLSCSEYIKKECFPLKDYELVKIFDYYLKVKDDLVTLLNVLSKRKEPNLEDPQEAQKIQKRAMEFNTRFSRHHLYPLRLETRQLQEHLNKFTSRSPREPLQKKMTAVYQSMSQALTTYISYFQQNSLVGDKLKDFLNLLKTIDSTTNNLLLPIKNSVDMDDANFITIKCEEILNILEKPVEVVKPKKAKPKKRAKNLDVNCLSMYEPKLGSWQLKSQDFARMKFAQKVQEQRKRQTQRSENLLEKKASTPNVKDKVMAIPNKCEPPTEVLLDPDVESEIRKHKLDNEMEKTPSKSKLEVLQKPESSKLSATLCTTAATTKEKEVSAFKNEHQGDGKLSRTRSNVGFFHFVSSTEDKEEKAKEEDEKPGDKKEDTLEKERDMNLRERTEKSTKQGTKSSKWPFEELRTNSSNLKTLNISADTFRQLKRFKKSMKREEYSGEAEPWEIITRVSEYLLSDILDEVLDELVDEQMIQKLLENELLIVS